MKDLLIKVQIIRILALFLPIKGGMTQMGWNAAPLVMRKKGRPYQPWWVFGAIDFIEQLVSPKSRVLELGSGASTLFWAHRGNNVVSLENNESWYQLMQTKARSLPQISLIFGEPIDIISTFSPGSFDVIVIDHFTTSRRTDVVPDCIKLITDEGLIIWDNSDRKTEKDGIEMLKEAGFREVSFFGVSPNNFYSSTTSVFSKRLPERDWEIFPRRSIEY